MTGSRTIRALSRGEGEGLGQMTYPAYRHLLALDPMERLPQENETDLVEPIAIAAIEGGAVAGLLLGDVPVESGGSPRLLSVFVVPGARRRGIAGELVQAFEDQVRDRGFASIEAIYTAGKTGVGWMERVFDGRGWSEPETRMVSVRLDVELAKQAPWLWRQRLSSGWEIFEWKTLTEDDKREIRESNERSPWIAPDLQPWRHDAGGFEPRTSLGIRRKGEIVGWNITHLMSDSTLRFTCSFIRKPLGRRGKILPMYAESFRRMLEAGLKYATLTVPLHHEGMAAFSKRWIGPWSEFVGETRGRRIDLNDIRMTPVRPTESRE